ncbi:NAD(P)-dependent oxidoreductase [Propionispora hippei]|uniref:D-3-phosphoglycerate dehydrogenase n=1 Tax=Propionispora hippei DSM 15287 TaxID=1123003 RepID=A0A1M6EY88_9FIRM|nr:NAD(P)-dependent oxidoreductase [Propionispora hippei]SHI90390.1 D-3-phosphoglycerate dehydrogenase [Propionispora hippei DSM 15287]
MKIAIIEPLGVEREKLLQIAAQVLGKDADITYYDSPPADQAEVVARSRAADIVVLANMPYREAVLAQCPQITMLSVAFTGIDHIDMAYCRRNNITVCNCAGYSNEAVGELVFGLVLGLYRRLIACDTAVRRGGTKDGLIGFELAGKKFGIVGTGAIGLKVAALARAFGCEVYAYSRTVKDSPGIRYVDLDTLLATCDIVSLHVPLMEQTRELINREKLALMKQSAVLINTARGPVVDAAALAEALTEGRLAGAAVDVFEQEPPIPAGQPLLQAPNVILAPHVGFATKEALVKRAVIAFENIKQWLAKTPQNVM